HDFGGTGSRLVDVALYAEDPARPHYPDVQNPLGGQTGVAPAPGVLAYTSVLFAAPVLAPVGRDLFVGITVAASSGGVASGVYLAFIPGIVGTIPYDLPGAGLPTTPPEANNYRVYREFTNGTLTYGTSPGQFLIDLVVTSPSGMPCAITNQTNWTISNAPPG